jgi:hypothetical protein
MKEHKNFEMYKKSTSSMPSIGRAHGATVSFSWQFCSMPVEFASLKDDFTIRILEL